MKKRRTIFKLFIIMRLATMIISEILCDGQGKSIKKKT